MKKIGAAKFNDKSKSAIPDLPVLNPGIDRIRFTIDLHGLNKETIPLDSAIQDLETTYRSLESSTVYTNNDMCHAYLKIALDSERQGLNVYTNSQYNLYS